MTPERMAQIRDNRKVFSHDPYLVWDLTDELLAEVERLRQIASDFWAYHEVMLEAARNRESRWVQQPALDEIYDRLLTSCAAVLGKPNPLEEKTDETP